MPRYIDADALVREICFHDCECELENCGGSPCDEVKRIMDAPTVSPDEVRGVGKWIRIPGFHLDHEYYPARYQCDQCKHFVDSGDDRNYCPHCGAKMEVGE